MQIIWKSLLFTISIASLFGSMVLGQEVPQNWDEQSICDNVIFTLVGPESVILEEPYTYSLSVALLDSSSVLSDNISDVVVPQDIIQSTDVRYEFLFETRMLERSSEQDFSVTFSELWSYTLRAIIDYEWCDYTIEKTIVSYDDIFVYIGPYLDEFGLGIIQNMWQNGLFLRPFIVMNDTTTSGLVPSLRQHWSTIAHAQDIYFSLQNYSLIFDVLRLMDTDPSIDLSSKRIFIVDDMQKSIVKKFLARFARTLDTVWLYVVSSQEAINMFLQLSIGQTDYDENVLSSSYLQFSWSRISYSFGYVIDYLLFQWFPLDMLLLILSCVVAVLFIVFCKQILGFSSFGVYYPLLFAISLHVVWLKTSLFLLLIAFIARMTVIGFTRRFTLLATAKLWLQVVLYILFTVIGLVFVRWFGLIDSDFIVFTYPMTLFVYIAILLVASKLWTTSLTWFSMKQFSIIVFFLVLSWLSYLIIQSDWVHHIILLYPSTILFAIVVIVWLGRYTGLQLVEFVRFWPLIKYIKGKK